MFRSFMGGLVFAAASFEEVAQELRGLVFEEPTLDEGVMVEVGIGGGVVE